MKPIFKLEVNSVDVTKMINLNSSKISFKDEAGMISDEISLQIEGIFKRPKFEDSIKLWLGTEEQELMYCGEFKIQTLSVTQGQSNSMNITATAADFNEKFKVKRSQSYENVSLKQIASIIATRNNLPIVSDLDDIYVLHTEQTNESDLSFLRRLSLDFDTLFSIKNQTLIFKKKKDNNGKSKNIAVYDLPLSEMSSLKITPSNKTKYQSCKAVWRDTKNNEKKSIVIGKGDPQLVIQDLYENESEAKQKADAKFEQAKEGLKTGQISTYGFHVYAGGILNLTGTFEDDGEYWIKNVQHTLDSSGWNISMEISN